MPKLVVFINQETKKVDADKNNKYFYLWRKFLLNKIKENNIEVIYTILPMAGEEDVLISTLNKKCYSEKKLRFITNFHQL